MINYYFKKEKFPIIKNVLIYNKAYKSEKFFNNEHKNDRRNSVKRINYIVEYIDITSKFIFIYNNFSEICEKFDMYYKTDLNPQSKNNIILILKIILFEIFIVNKNDKK